MAEKGTWPYRFELIPLDQLFVDPDYQRPLSGFLKKIKREYDPAMIKTLAVSDRRTRNKRRYAVIDGQTRMEGMRFHDEAVAPCVVYENLTPAQEAELFARFQTERRGMATYLRFRAALAAKKPEAAAIALLVRSEGFKVAGDGDNSGIRSVAALEWLYRRDAELLRRVLSIVRACWGTDTGAGGKFTGTRGEVLRGLGRFLRETDADDQRLIDRLTYVSPDQLRHRANQLREGSGSSGNYDMFIKDALIGIYASRPRSNKAA